MEGFYLGSFLRMKITSSIDGKAEKPSHTKMLLCVDIWGSEYNPLESKESDTLRSNPMGYKPLHWHMGGITILGRKTEENSVIGIS